MNKSIFDPALSWEPGEREIKMQVDMLIEMGLSLSPRGFFFRMSRHRGEKIVGIYDSSQGPQPVKKLMPRELHSTGSLEPHAIMACMPQGSLEGHFETETASAAIGG